MIRLKVVVVICWAAAVALCSAFMVSEGKAATPQKHRVHLTAKPRMQVWKTRPLRGSTVFAIFVDGEEVDPRGTKQGCRYSLVIRRLAVKVNYCGKRFVMRYFGSTNFMLIWKKGGYL